MASSVCLVLGISIPSRLGDNEVTEAAAQVLHWDQIVEGGLLLICLNDENGNPLPQSTNVPGDSAAKGMEVKDEGVAG